ncbi:hypothetical protein OIU84_024524 [Salix udensis]|uniref:SEC7 domain-containing protein n=1 Tax=Salix udensis TaxID=889485 RepID=A0AAD6PBD1_9ROSI|nr:hypothetical protein OIU84_024524 [Salix udensis]
MVSGIVLILYYHLRAETKTPARGFLLCDFETCTEQIGCFLPAARGCHGGSCRLPAGRKPLMVEMHASLDCDGMAERICNGSYTVGLDKNLVGDFLGNHDDFCVQILHELAWTFDFQDMNVDTALRLFLETVTLPGESQKLQRALEAFSERYYEQPP